MRAAGGPGGSAPGRSVALGRAGLRGRPPLALLPGLGSSPVGRGAGWEGACASARAPGKERSER